MDLSSCIAVADDSFPCVDQRLGALYLCLVPRICCHSNPHGLLLVSARRRLHRALLDLSQYVYLHACQCHGFLIGVLVLFVVSAYLGGEVVALSLASQFLRTGTIASVLLSFHHVESNIWIYRMPY